MITYIIIAACVLLSYQAFRDISFFKKLEFNPYLVASQKEQYRIITHAFIHGDWTHLFFNMFVLFQFGVGVEDQYEYLFEEKSKFYFLILYFGGIFAASVPALLKHKDNPYYSSIGASGAVAAVLFSFILLNPLSPLSLIILPGLKIPAVVLGIAYLLIENYLDKKGRDNIAHDAHYWGAIFGFVITIIFDPILFLDFIQQITQGLTNFFS